MAPASGYDIAILDEREWDTNLSQFSHRTVFHSSAWLKTLAASHKLNVTCAGAFRDGCCEAVFPILHTRKGLLRVVGSPLPGWSTAYLGPLFQRSCDAQDILAAFFENKCFRKYSYFACKVLHDAAAPGVDLSRFGFSVVLCYDTFRLNLLQSPDTLWSNCRRECRNHIRKAEKYGVEIRAEEDASFLDDYWSMTVETFARAGVHPTHDRRFIDEMWRQLHPAGMLNVLSAFHEGQRVGTLMLLSDHRTMYYWGGASYLRYRHLSAHNLLQWTAINHARDLGMTTYDFISTTGGPGKFKQSFGPECVTIATHWEKTPSRIMGVIKQRYEKYLRNRQRLTEPKCGRIDNKPLAAA